RDLPERSRPGARGARTVLRVGTGTKGATCTGDDGDPRVLVVAKLQPGGVEVGANLRVDRVHGVGTVVGDRRDMAVTCIDDGPWHARPPARGTEPCVATVPVAPVLPTLYPDRRGAPTDPPLGGIPP